MGRTGDRLGGSARGDADLHRMARRPVDEQLQKVANRRAQGRPVDRNT